MNLIKLSMLLINVVVVDRCASKRSLASSVSVVRASRSGPMAEHATTSTSATVSRAIITEDCLLILKLLKLEKSLLVA